MKGEKDLDKLLSTMEPRLNPGNYVFCSTRDIRSARPEDVLMIFREEEGYTLILEQELADRLGLEYSFVASWISLTVHSSLEAVGLTAAFSTALAENGISCNVVAAYYHDHIFVNKADGERAMDVLRRLSAHA